MESYVLPQSSERLVLVAKPTMKALIPAILFTVLVPYLGWFIGPFIVILGFLALRSSKLVLTTHKVELVWGILRKNSKFLSHSQIQSVSVYRGILQRIFGVATIRVPGLRVNLKVNASKANEIVDTLQRVSTQFTDFREGTYRVQH
jgi:uncharacterized membrane protein YdbT with pleckstrin-like domain